MLQLKNRNQATLLTMRILLASFITLGTALYSFPASAQATPEQLAAVNGATTATATLPVTIGWFNGQPAFYTSTEASDQAVAVSFGANYVPELANAINSPLPSVDDIYAVTNFKQGNVIPSAPLPAGPGNTNTAYSPLWQITTVTWAAGTKPHVLRSEKAVKDAAANGLVTLVKTNIVVNCAVIYTPQGGVLPGAIISIKGH